MLDKTLQIEALHRAYYRLTGLEVPLTLPKMFVWERWMSHGWTEADLSLVVGMLRNKLSKEVLPSCLRFSRLIEDTEHFAEDLAEARARARKPVYAKDKAACLRCSGRADEPETAPARSAGDVMKANAALAELLKVRDAL